MGVPLELAAGIRISGLRFPDFRISGPSPETGRKAGAISAKAKGLNGNVKARGKLSMRKDHFST